MIDSRIPVKINISSRLGFCILFVVFVCSTSLFSQTKGTGLIINQETNAQYAATETKSADLGFQDPIADISSYSLKQYVPETKDQMDKSTCVGWSVAYYGRTIIEAIQNNISDKGSITKGAFSPTFTYLQSNVEFDEGCTAGADLNKAFLSMKNTGAVKLSELSDACIDELPVESARNAAPFRIRDYQKLFEKDEDPEFKVEQIKRALVSDNPVIIAFSVEENFYKSGDTYSPNYENQIVAYHAMCVIGYDDEKFNDYGAFEVVNSHGPEWGNGGYTWIKYTDFAEYVLYAFEMIPGDSPTIANNKNKLAGSLEIKLSSGFPVAVERSNASGGFNFQTVENESIGDYRTKKVYKDAQYRMQANINQPAYVYVLGSEEINGTNILFPGKGVSAYINSELLSLRIPSKGKIIKLTEGDLSSDYTIILFSRDRIDIEKEVKGINALDTLAITDKLNQVFGKRLIQGQDMQLEDDQMSFEAEFKEGSIAMLILDIRRK